MLLEPIGQVSRLFITHPTARVVRITNGHAAARVAFRAMRDAPTRLDAPLRADGEQRGYESGLLQLNTRKARRSLPARARSPVPGGGNERRQRGQEATGSGLAITHS